MYVSLGLFYILLISVHCVASECNIESPLESCDGPVDITKLYRENIEETNGGCNINEVPFKPNQNEDEDYICGQCEPGFGGWEDPKRACNINEYCDDFGKCRLLTQSPFYGAACPYEVGLGVGWCGPGLKCYNHLCYPCLDGMIDFSDGKICVSNEWTYSKWRSIFYSPEDILMLVILVILILALLIPTLIKVWRAGYTELKKRRKELDNETNRSNYRNSDDSKYSDSESEPSKLSE